MQDYRVEDVSSRRLSRDAKWAYSFLLVHKENLHAYTMYARTENRKRELIDALQEALDNVVPDLRRSTHAAAMHTFDKPTSCAYCHKLLKGLFYQVGFIFLSHFSFFSVFFINAWLETVFFLSIFIITCTKPFKAV